MSGNVPLAPSKSCKRCAELFTPSWRTARLCDTCKTKKFCSRCGESVDKLQRHIEGHGTMCLSCYVAHSHTVSHAGNSDEWIECRICGFRGKEIATHIINSHGITAADYGATKSKTAIARVIGSGNPGYQHGGMLSPWSEKSGRWTPEQIQMSRKKALDNAAWYTLGPTNSFLRTFYASSEAYASGQARTVGWFVGKYGEEEGRRRHASKTEKWLATLDQKSDAEKKEITRKKITNGRSGGTSKAERELASSLLLLGIEVSTQLPLKKPSGRYMYDIAYSNKIIEFNGDFWHSNPKTYAPEYYNQRTKKTAKQKWEEGTEKIKLAESNGYKVMVVWGSDIKSNKKEIVEKCANFLTT